MPDILPSPRRSGHVKSIYLRRTIQHTPVSPCTSAPRFSLDAPFLQFNPTASCNGINPSPCEETPAPRRAVRKNTETKKSG